MQANKRDFTDEEVVSRTYSHADVNQDATHVTARETLGICRECGRDIPGGHESMKCYLHRSYTEEWTNVD
jgi:hypothetical protein